MAIEETYSFPYLGVDQEQATAVLLSFANQTQLFHDISQGDGFLHTVALAAGLIGFVSLIALGPILRLSIISWVSWLVLAVLLIVYPLAEPLFFQGLVPKQIDVANSPYAQVPGGMPIPGGETPADRMADKGFNPTTQIGMFTPQIVAIHILNRLRSEFAITAARDPKAALNSRLASLQHIRRGQVVDYRPHYDMASFLTLCQRKVPGLANKQWLDKGELQAVDQKLYTDLQKATFTVSDVIDAHEHYWRESVRVLSSSGNGQCTGGNNDSLACLNTTGLPPLAVVRDSDKQFLADEKIGMLIAETIYAKTGAFDGNNFKRYLTDAPAQNWNFGAFMTKYATLNPANRAIVDKIPVTLHMASVDNAGEVKADTSFLGMKKNEVSNCADLQDRVVKSFERALTDQLKLHSNLTASLERWREEVKETGVDGKKATDLPVSAQMRLAVENEINRILKFHDCDMGTQAEIVKEMGVFTTGEWGSDPFQQAKSMCKANGVQAKKELAQLKNFLLSSSMVNANPEVDTILQRAMRPDFRSPFRDIAAEMGDALAPWAVFWRGLFGGFGAGTYSALMPMLITFFLGMTIIFTPVVYIIGLMVPTWAPGILIFPIITVIYLKTVELSFVLVNWAFQMMFAISSVEKGSKLADFTDIMLGMAYTSCFLISLVLLFGLKNPAGLIQKVAGIADKQSQISFGEAVAMGGAIKVGAKTAASFLPGGAGLKAIGALGGSVANVMDGRGGFSDTIMEGFGASRKAADDRHMNAEIVRNMPRESQDGIAARANAKVKDAFEARTLEQAKGMGISAPARKPSSRGIDYETANGYFRVNQDFDPPVIELGDFLHKRTGMAKSEGHELSLRMFESGAARMQKDDDQVPRLDINIEKLEQQFSKQGAAGIINNLKNTGQVSEYTDLETKQVHLRLNNVPIPDGPTGGKLAGARKRPQGRQTPPAQKPQQAAPQNTQSEAPAKKPPSEPEET